MATQLNRAFAVGLLVATSATILLVVFTFFRQGGLSKGDSYVVHTYFKDATGLTWKSSVQIAGIQVGEVEAIHLVGDRAELDLRIRRDIIVRSDACLVKHTPSLLITDAVLDLALGNGEPLMDKPESEREITCVQESAGFSKIFDNLSQVATDVQRITGQLSGTLGGEQGSIKEIVDNLVRVSETINRTIEDDGRRLSHVLGNVEAFTGDIAHATGGESENIKIIIHNMEAASEQVKSILTDVQGITGTNKPELKETTEGLRSALDKLNDTLDKIDKVATDVEEGKGVAGKLLTDERLGNKLSNTIEGVSNYVDRVMNLQTELSLRSEFLLNETGVKSYFGIRLIPSPDKFYMLQIISDPRGYQTQTVDTATSQTTGAVTVPSMTTTTTTTHTDEQQLLISLEMGKRFGPVALRAGMIESSGGVGVDCYLLKDSLKFSIDMFQFDRPIPGQIFPHAKLWADYIFLQHLYATIGSDDFLNNWHAGQYPGGPKFSFGQDVFFGGGLFFTDDDLKAILTTVGGSVGSATR